MAELNAENPAPPLIRIAKNTFQIYNGLHGFPDTNGLTFTSFRKVVLAIVLDSKYQ